MRASDTSSAEAPSRAQTVRRKVGEKEKQGWVSECRGLLQERGLKGTQEEIAKALDLSQQWVSKYDPDPDTYHKSEKRLPRRGNLQEPLYSVWGFMDNSWRQLIVKADQPRYEFYHGITPAFVIENLLKLYEPKLVLAIRERY